MEYEKQKIDEGIEKRGLPKPLHRMSEKERLERRARIRIGSEILAYAEGFMRREGFVQMLPVLLSPITDPLWPDPAAGIYKRLEVDIYGTTVRTMHSMIVHKLVGTSMLLDRFFVVSPNIRLEKPERASTGRHLFEFSQMDFEASGASSAEIRSLIERMLHGLAGHVGSSMKDEFSAIGAEVPRFKIPFSVYEREELEKEYGKDWEDELPKHISEPAWIVDLPREFYDFEDPETHRWDNFDLYLPKRGELVTGALREFEYEKMLSKMEGAGVKKELYSLLLELAKDGRIRQSAGAGIGMERLIAWFTDAPHVGDVQAFPKVPGVVYEL
ncbi:asparagine synthetase A [Candidatus Marsarchaeota archaeon]|nr:asparagine synthetase A [Candidatus Marsarchaeota archaeon]